MDHTIRVDRKNDQLRSLRVTYDVYSYASGSVLFELGNTKVLCAITLQQGIPYFLRNKKTGWLTAEYSMLPASTPVRTVREITANKKSGRNIEISRLIGRCLRAVTNLDLLGEHTIFIDCDVLQADGGTRTACITGAYLALKSAISKWIREKVIKESILVDELAAVSVGIAGHTPMLDLNFVEDSATDADFNFIVTRSGKVIEIQGCAESIPVSWEKYNSMQRLALKGAQDLYDFYDKNFYEFEMNRTYPQAFTFSQSRQKTVE